MAVLVERSTEHPWKYVAVGGEPMSKGPTVGKVKPGMTFAVRNYRGDYRAHKLYQWNCSDL